MTEIEKDLQYQKFHEEWITPKANTVTRCPYCEGKNIDCPFPSEDNKTCLRLNKGLK